MTKNQEKQPIDLKSKLQLKFIEETFNYGQDLALGIMVKWNNYLVLRKGVEVKTYITEGTEIIDIEEEDEETGEITIHKEEVPKILRYMTQREIQKEKKYVKKILLDWFDRMVLNYSDLTKSQKQRLNKIKFIGSDKDDMCGPEILNYVKMKRIRIREHQPGSYLFFDKIVIIELLDNIYVK